VDTRTSRAREAARGFAVAHDGGTVSRCPKALLTSRRGYAPNSKHTIFL